MELVITEKPDMARKIAAVIGASQNRREWLEGNGYCVTWMYGHLLTLKVPEAEGKWTLEDLPILPERFELEPLPQQLREGQRNRIEVIRELMDRCDSFIEATDAGREGELIFRNLYEYVGIRKRFRRLWISSLTEESIAEGFRNLYDGRDFDGLAKAARQRERADWMVGINATRAFTLALGSENVMSLGRVQTPTLCLICDRYVEHERFKPEKYWYIKGESAKDGVTMSWRGKDRYMSDSREKAQGDFEKVKAAGYLTVDEVKTERKTEEPPLLHDLTSLQKAANAKYSFGMDKTQDIAQSLYERQLITYPRTGSRYIPEDVFRTIPSLLQRFTGHGEYGEAARRLSEAERLNRRSVNDTKITDHHALLPTGRAAEGLSDDERCVYDLVLSRMLEAFSPVCVADVTTVQMSAEGVTFEARGRKDVSLGWRAVTKSGDYEDVRPENVDDVVITMKPLPELAEGDRVRIATMDLVEDATKPRPLLTDSTLLSAMQNAGQGNENRDVAAALKDIGIGTVATRAEIFKTLRDKRHYVTMRGKSVVPTRLGLNVYSAVRDRSIASVELTAKWEMALEEIADGKREEAAFEDDIRRYTTAVVKNLLKGERLQQVRDALQREKLKCPNCGKEIKLFDKSAWCRECKFTVWRSVARKRLGDETMKKLIREGQSGLISGFKNKDGKTFEAYLKLERDGRLSFEFPKKRDGGDGKPWKKDAVKGKK